MPIPDYLASLRKKVGHDLILVPTVVVIVRNSEGELLMVHDCDCDQWTIPGGIMEPGESPANAAVREVWEETNVIVKPTRIIGVVGGEGGETHYSNGDKIGWVATIFGAEVVSGTPVHDGLETGEARFVPDDERATLNVRADTIRFLEAERYDVPFFERSAE